MAERNVRGGAHVWALILAGGAGERMAMDRPKAFVSLAGRPLLSWSIESFAMHPRISDVLAIVPRGWEVAFRDEILSPWSARPDADSHAKIHAAIEGGPHRQDSARIGLEAIRTRTSDSELDETIVLIHDAARPNVAPQLIELLVESLLHEGPCAGLPRADGPVAVVPVVPVEDTLKAVSWPAGDAPEYESVADSDRAMSSEADRDRARVGEAGRSAMPSPTSAQRCGQISRTVPRKGLWRAQTPQGFFLRPILEAHLSAARTHASATDDASLYELNGWPVEAIPGSRLNVKIARPEDLRLLEAWFGAEQRR